MPIQNESIRERRIKLSQINICIPCQTVKKLTLCNYFPLIMKDVNKLPHIHERSENYECVTDREMCVIIILLCNRRR